MDSIYISSLINILLITAFILDRIFRLRSINEYKLAKEAQIENLKQQLDIERRNNDIEITEMHKKRYESLKVILGEKEEALLTLKTSLENAVRNVNLSDELVEQLVAEINRLALYKKILETEKQALKAHAEASLKYPDYRTYRERLPDQ